MKKFILAFAISGMFIACNNHSTTSSENDSVVTDTVVEQVVEYPDSCTCDSVCVDTCDVCNLVVTE